MNIQTHWSGVENARTSHEWLWFFDYRAATGCFACEPFPFMSAIHDAKHLSGWTLLPRVFWRQAWVFGPHRVDYPVYYGLVLLTFLYKIGISRYILIIFPAIRPEQSP